MNATGKRNYNEKIDSQKCLSAVSYLKRGDYDPIDDLTTAVPLLFALEAVAAGFCGHLKAPSRQLTACTRLLTVMLNAYGSASAIATVQMSATTIAQR